VPNFYGQVPIADPDRFFQVLLYCHFSSSPFDDADGKRLQHAASHPLRFLECGDSSPLSKALTSQRTPHKREGGRAWP